MQHMYSAHEHLSTRSEKLLSIPFPTIHNFIVCFKTKQETLPHLCEPLSWDETAYDDSKVTAGMVSWDYFAVEYDGNA